MSVFDRIVNKLGSQTALAALCRVSPQAVSKWRAAGIPPRQCVRIAEATGIDPREMRPEVFGSTADAQHDTA